MQIEYLADRPEFVETIAGWIYGEWPEEFAKVGFQAWLIEFGETVLRQGIPTTLVATEGDELVGTASLIASDMPTQPGLWPWLASVYVVPSARQRGIASALVDRVESEAGNLGFDRLYLQTRDRADFYRRRGWQMRERTEFCGHDVSIMSRELGAARRSA
jgi:N-acetylglutamate synthase-like GNAT family acetyltransferase